MQLTPRQCDRAGSSVPFAKRRRCHSQGQARDERTDADAESKSARKTKARNRVTLRRTGNAQRSNETLRNNSRADQSSLRRDTEDHARRPVIVVDANSGKILREKIRINSRPAASTQKLLTALIVAESGFLDRQVTVQPTDTMADPVKLNIKAGDTYQRIDLLRALLVKSPNDVRAMSGAG